MGNDDKVLPQNTEEKLRQAERRIENILESFSDAFFTTDRDWRFTYINRHAEVILGRPSADLLGKNMWEEFPEAVETEIYDHYQKAVAEHITVNFETFYPPFDAWFEVRAYPSPDGGLSVYFHNISDRKYADAVLRASEERYRTLFNSIDEGFCVLQMMFDKNDKAVDFKFLEINPAFEKLTGISAEDALSDKTMRQIIPDLEEKWFETYGGVALTGKPVRVADISEAMNRWFDVYPFRIGEPEERKVAVLFNNITEKKLAEESLRESRERLNFALEAAEIGDWDLDLMTGEATRSLLHDKCFGAVEKPFEEWSYEKFKSFVHPDDLEEVDRKFGLALSEQKEWNFECRVIWADKSVHWIEGHGSVYRTTDGKPVRMLGIVADITERKRAELNLEFLAGISQELARLNGVEEILQIMTGKIGKYLGVENCVFAEVDTIANTANVDPLWRVNETAVDFSGEYQLSEFVSDEFRQTLGTDTPVVVNNVAEDSRTAENAAKFHQLKIGSFINTPFVSNGDLKFILGVYRQEAYEWRTDEIELLGELMTRIWMRIERARAEKALQESQERFSKAFNASPLVLTISSLTTGKLIEVNDTFVNATGYSREEAIGKTTLELGLWKNPRERKAEMQTVRQAGQISNVEYVFQTKTGGEIIGLLSAELIEIGGEPFALTVIQDITERKTAEQTIRESEERYRILAETASDAIIRIDATSTIEYTNTAVENVFGYAAEELVGQPLTMLMPEELRERHLAGFAHYLKTGEKNLNWLSIEVPAQHKDGHHFPLEISFGEYHQGSRRFFIGIARDITERKHSEDKLRESEEQLRALADSIPQLAWMAEADGFIFWYNRRWYEYTATTPEEMEGWGWQTVHDEEMLPKVLKRWQTSIRTGEPFEMEFPLRRGADKIFRWFLTRVVPIHDSNGKIVRWFGTNTDVEELRQSRLQAEQANRLKDEFLATLSHELRTPLNAILGWSKMLQTNNLGEDGAKKAVATIERNARSQNQLIEDLLDVSRIITGKLRLDIRAVDLPNVITAAIDAVRPAAEAKNIHLQILLDPRAGPISGDPDRLQQIIWNLLSNAVKFTPKNGRIQIRLERINSHIEIVVSDTGKGIEPEFLPNVFDRFSQSDGSMTRRHGGLGLGLAIVRQLVELHGGTVSVESDGSDHGTTFTVSLPLLPVRRDSISDVPRIHPKAEESGAGLDCPPELTGLRVLLVDDEADSRDLVNLVLEECGAEVVTAESASEALEAVKGEKFQIIISDIGMPDEDGFSLIRKIRRLTDEQGGNTPAIALTAYARAEDRVRALRSGFQIHIAKPVEPAELIAVVANLAGRMRNPENNADR